MFLRTSSLALRQTFGFRSSRQVPSLISLRSSSIRSSSSGRVVPGRRFSVLSSSSSFSASSSTSPSSLFSLRPLPFPSLSNNNSRAFSKVPISSPKPGSSSSPSSGSPQLQHEQSEDRSSKSKSKSQSQSQFKSKRRRVPSANPRLLLGLFFGTGLYVLLSESWIYEALARDLLDRDLTESRGWNDFLRMRNNFFWTLSRTELWNELLFQKEQLRASLFRFAGLLLQSLHLAWMFILGTVPGSVRFPASSFSFFNSSNNEDDIDEDPESFLALKSLIGQAVFPPGMAPVSSVATDPRAKNQAFLLDARCLAAPDLDALLKAACEATRLQTETGKPGFVILTLPELLEPASRPACVEEVFSRHDIPPVQTPLFCGASPSSSSSSSNHGPWLLAVSQQEQQLLLDPGLLARYLAARASRDPRAAQLTFVPSPESLPAPAPVPGLGTVPGLSQTPSPSSEPGIWDWDRICFWLALVGGNAAYFALELYK